MRLCGNLFRFSVAAFIGALALIPHSSFAAGVPFTVDLQYGMRNSTEVSQLQDFLRTEGYFNYITTGNFITITLAGVKGWQTAHCVPSTGYFGPISRRAAAAGTLCTSQPAAGVVSTSSNTESDQSLIVTVGGKAYVRTTKGLVAISSDASESQSAPAISVSVSPSSAQLDAFATTTLTAALSNTTNTAVTWSASSGTIDTDGVFTAPSLAATTTVTITATSVADSSKNGVATVTVVPITVTVTPSSVDMLGGDSKAFSASVAEATSSTVTWSASGGSISASGIFIAPAVVASTTYTITASSTIDALRAGTATVEVGPNVNFVGWWKLNEGTGSIAYDISGNDNDGSWSGTTAGDTGYYDTNAAPTFAYAGTFNGTDDAVTIPGIDIGSAKTISFWAYIPSLSGTTELVSKSSGGHGVEIIINSGTLQFWVMDGSTAYAAADPDDVNLNAWNLVTGTFDGPSSTITLYVNGVQSGSTATAPGSIGVVDNLYFGTWNSGGRFFDGMLNDIRLYTNELTSQQIEDLYNSYK